MRDPLLNWRRAEEETGSEIADQIGRLISSHVGNGATKQIELESVVGLPMFSFGGSAKDDLGRLAGCGERSNVGDTSALNGKEGEEEGQDDGENRHADRHVELDTHHDADANNGEDQSGAPHPHLHLVLGCGRVFDQICLVLMATVLLEEAKLLASGLANVVYALADSARNRTECKENDLVLKEQLGEGNSNHGQDTRPQHPVTGRWVVLVGSLAIKRHEGDISGPVRIIGDNGTTPCCAIVNKSRSNDSPGKDGAEEEGQGHIEADEDAGTDESWGELDKPAPVFGSKSSVLVLSPNEEPGEDVPVPENAQSILRHNTKDESTSESDAKSLHLHLADDFAGNGFVHATNRHGSSGRRWEDETQLTSNVDDEEFTKRSSEEESEVTGNGGQRDDAPVVVFRSGTHESELVQSWQSGNEDVAETSRGHGSRLDDVVFTGTKVTTENREVLAEGPGEGLDDSETNDSLTRKKKLVTVGETEPCLGARRNTYTEQVGGESPSGLETQINIGGIHECTTAQPHKDGTNGQDALRFVWEVVEGDKWVNMDNVLPVQVLLILGFVLDHVGLL